MARLSGPRRVESPYAEAPVTMLELFFDLVFVGTAIYLVGNSVHLWLLGLSSGWALKIAALVALGTIPIGHEVTDDVQVVALCVVIAVALVVSARVERRPMQQVA